MKILNIQFGTRFAYQVFLHVTLIVLAVEVVVLSDRANKMETTLSRLTAKSLAEGDTLRLGSVRSLMTSAPMELGPRSLIYLFTTSCPYCEKNMQTWQGIAGQALSKGLRVGAICLNTASKSRDSLFGYVREHQINFPVYDVSDANEFRKTNNVQGVPQTMICSADGKIERVWRGVLADDAVAEITSAISN
jgi:hypothetical protein